MDNIIIGYIDKLLKHQNQKLGCFNSDVYFNVWADAAYLILQDKISINNNKDILVSAILSQRKSDGSWGIISDPNSESSYKNTLFALYAIREYISSQEIKITEKWLKAYRGNKWIDPYTQIFLADKNKKIYYPPLFLSLLPNVVFKIFGNLNMLFGKLFDWTIFIYPSAWSRNVLPQLSCIGYLLKKGKAEAQNNQLFKLVLQRFKDSQLDNGSYFDTILPTISSVYLFYLLGYSLDCKYIKNALIYLENQMKKNSAGLNRFNLTVWNTSLSLIALLKYKELNILDIKDEIKLGVDFLIKSQLKNGGWAFSHNHRVDLTDNDDTALAIIALSYARDSYKVPQRTIDKGIEFLLKKQNMDGGWGAFDKNQSNKRSGYIPPWHIYYGHELKDPSTADVTGNTICALGLNGFLENSKPIKKAITFLIKDQMKEGCWYGRWGICYLYGTYRALLGLKAVGLDKNNLLVKKALSWIISMQNDDGGWGESYQSYYSDTPIFGQSNLEHTAWATESLLIYSQSLSIDKAVNYLKIKEDTICPSYSAAAIEPARYDIYSRLFPLISLKAYGIYSKNKYKKRKICI